MHAARTTNGKLTVVAINRSRTDARTAEFKFAMPAGKIAGLVKVFRLSASGGARVQPGVNAPQSNANAFTDLLPPMSATLYEVRPAPATVAQAEGSPTDE